MLHIKLQAYLISKVSSSRRVPYFSRNAVLPESRYVAILKELRRWVFGLKSGRKISTYWNNYAELNTYSGEIQKIKRDFVAEWARKIPGGVIWDIGGNTGEYSEAAIQSGVGLSIIFDSDIDSLEKVYARSRHSPRTFPVLMDISNHSPNQGWNQRERGGLNERNRPDGLIPTNLS